MLRRREEPDVKPELLVDVVVGVEVRPGALGVDESDVIAVEEGVLHHLPVDVLVERSDPEARELIELHGIERIGQPVAEPLVEIEGRAWVVDDPDQSVSLAGRQRHQTHL